MRVLFTNCELCGKKFKGSNSRFCSDLCRTSNSKLEEIFGVEPSDETMEEMASTNDIE